MKKLIINYRKILPIIVLTIMANILSISVGVAFHVEKRPIIVEQPNGKKLNLFVSGDQYYHWLFDEGNYTIVQDSRGYYVYAQMEADTLKPTPYEVGQTDPKSVGLVPGANYSAEYLNELRRLKGAYKVQPSYFGNLKKGVKNGRGAVFQSATMNPLVMYVRFKGETEFVNNSKSYYNGVFNNDENSLKNYFRWNSYNQLTITSTIVGGSETTIASYEDSQPRSYYQKKSEANPNGYEGDAERTFREFSLWKSTINALKSSVPLFLDIDGNDDGWIDYIFFVVKGSTNGWGDILWPHQWHINSNILINGAKAGSFMCVFEDWHDPGLLSHETGHVLGAPDLYRYTTKDITPIGVWDLMAHQTNPGQSMSAYTKMKYMEFIKNIPEINASGKYTLYPLGTTGQAFKIPSTKAGEYFVLEYRKKTSSMYESQIPGSGLIIHRINSTKQGNGDGPADEIYTYRPGGINNSTNGTLSDAYYSANTGRTSLTDITPVKAFMSDGSLGHLNIFNVSEAADFIVFYYKKPYCLSTNIDHLQLTNAQTTSSSNIEAIESIKTLGAITVNSGVSVSLTSEKVVLLSGFRASTGSALKVKTPNCGAYQPIPAAVMLTNANIAVSDGLLLDRIEEINTFQENSSLSMEVYPNPAEDFVKVALTNGKGGINTIEICNSSGVKIKTIEVDNIDAPVNIDLTELSAGFYYLKATSKEGTAIRKISIK